MAVNIAVWKVDSKHTYRYYAKGEYIYKQVIDLDGEYEYENDSIWYQSESSRTAMMLGQLTTDDPIDCEISKENGCFTPILKETDIQEDDFIF